MLHAIDPKIDCVFKALLGAEENRNLLLHFLNAILAQELQEPLVWVEILNPYNDKEFINDKLSIVDIKARDEHQHLYQIEIQLCNYPHLPARILYNWADIYSQQLQSGQDYNKLKSTYAIWLLADNLLNDNQDYLHDFKMRDQHGRTFCWHGGIWLLELNKFHAGRIDTEQQRWLKFFKEGETLNDDTLPDWMNTQEMKQAMSTLSRFSEKERAYFQYQARQDFIREQRTIQYDLEQAALRAAQAEQATKAAEETAKAAEEAAKAAEEAAQELAQELNQARQEIATTQLNAETEKQRAKAALAEIERLKMLLAKKDT